MMKILWVVLWIGVMASDVRARDMGELLEGVGRVGEHMLSRVTALGNNVIERRQAGQQERKDRLRNLRADLHAMLNPKKTWNIVLNSFDSSPPADAIQVEHLQDDIRRLESEIAKEEAEINALQKNVLDTASTIAVRAADVAANALTGHLSEQRDIALATNKAAVKAHVNNPRLERQAAADRAETTKRLKYGLAGLTASSLLIMGAYFGFRHFFKERPKIIRPQDTSISFWPKKAVYPRSRLDKLILSPALQEAVMQKFQGMEFAITKGLPLSNMLFYGPPGVGKSLAAQEFVRSLSDKKLAHHIIIRGPAFQQFARPGQAVSAIRAIFEAAEHSYKKTKKPTIIDFEEAEILFADRGNPAISTEMSRSTLTTFLGLMNESTSDHIAFIATTNHKNDLDPAFRDRAHISNHILFDAPEQEEREIFLRQYLNDVLVEKGFVVSKEVIQQIPVLAKSIAGLSGRQISGMIAQAIYPLLNAGELELTLPRFKKIIADTMAKKQSV